MWPDGCMEDSGPVASGPIPGIKRLSRERLTKNRLQMDLLQLFLIGPLRAVAPIGCVYWGWRILQYLRGRTPLSQHAPKGFAGRLLRSAQDIIKTWLSVEVAFFGYYFHKKMQFQMEVAKPPQIEPGQALPMLRRMFQATEDIQEWSRMADGGSRHSALCSRASSAQDLQQLLHPCVNESNVEDLLREWETMQQEAPLFTHGAASTTLAGHRDRGLPLGALNACSRHSCSRQSIERMLDDAEMSALKHAEVSGWFVRRSTGSCDRWPAVHLGEICENNMREFLAWAFYHCAPDEVPRERLQEFDQLLEEGIRWVGMRFPPGYNRDAQPMRVTMDKVNSQHRPLSQYVFTSLVLPFINSVLLHRLGFKHYKSGTLSYWHRPADHDSRHSVDSESDCEPPGLNRGDGPGIAHRTLPPLVFVHGLGLNLLPYYFFIRELLTLASGRAVLLVSLPHISMCLQEHVPSSAETVACLSDMLSSWGYAKGHFIGHSFGSLPLAWMVRRAPNRVSMVSFIDPVCFLIIKPDVCYNFIYKRPTCASELLSSFFVARELFIAHSLSRNFFWFENLLWPEDISMPCLVALSGKDGIVPAHSVRRYLSVYKQRHGVDTPKVVWFQDHAHGECFFPSRLDSCQSIIREMLALEASRSSCEISGSLGGT